MKDKLKSVPFKFWMLLFGAILAIVSMVTGVQVPGWVIALFGVM